MCDAHKSNKINISITISTLDHIISLTVWIIDMKIFIFFYHYYDYCVLTVLGLDTYDFFCCCFCCCCY